MSITKKITETKVRIYGRISYPHLFQPYAMDGQEKGKYQTNIILDPEDKEGENSIKLVKAAIEEAKKAGIISKWGGKEPKKLQGALQSGDDKEDEAYEGMWYVNAKANTKPGLINRQKDIITDEEELYSGCYVLATVTFYAYDVNGNKGVACGLDNIMKWKDGDRLGGRTSADSDFDDIEEEEDDL